MGKLIDLTGKKFGRLTVLHRSTSVICKHGDDAVWCCLCDCGNIVEKSSRSLRKGLCNSCGCLLSEKTSKRCLSISIGDVFGKLTVIERVTPVGQKPVKWRCLCSCGNTTVVVTDSLKRGATKSCGCIHSKQVADRNTKHGKSGTRLYNIWRGMKSRCYNENSTPYKYYGAKGVKVCDEWRNDFSSFADWSLANGYDPDKPRNECTIDRIDPSGDYSPDNCRWVSMSVQNSNKRK